MRALVPEAQTLFTVVQTVVSGRPALRAHWRAGFWPRLEKMCELLGTSVVGMEVDCSLCGENIAVEYLFDIFGLQGRYSLKSGCDSPVVSLFWIVWGRSTEGTYT